MSNIIEVFGREILDSRGNPTVEVEVITESGISALAGVPSGASTGSYEAVELRDGDLDRYLGKGVTTAVDNVNTKIADALMGQDVKDQVNIDKILRELDATSNKANLGANAILGASMACAKAGADEAKLPLFQYIGGSSCYKLPVPLMNILNGGAHADNGLDVQEFMIVPLLGDSFKEALRCGCEIFHNLKKILNEKSLSTGVGDEGGFAPKLSGNEEALSLLSHAIEKAGYKVGEEVALALDVASTEFFKDGKYQWEGQSISGQELGDIYKAWCEKYPIVSIEDGFSEDDWDSWEQFTKNFGHRLQLVGDDLFVTNPGRLKQGIEQGAANSLLVKINQIGSITETWDAVNMAHKASYTTVMSHRSGETEDCMIADLSVAMQCAQIKTGSLCRGERIVKYNQLLRIEEALGDSAVYWGKEAFTAV